MKSTIFLAASGAALALAGPVMKRDVVYDVVTDVQEVYVTQTVTVQPDQAKAVATPTTTSSPDIVWVYETVTVGGAPQPQPTTTSTPEAAPTTQPAQEFTAQAVTSTEVAAAATEAPSSTVEAASSTVQAADTSSPTDYITQSVWSHNKHRSNHSAPAVEWLDEIAGYAANTAATCKFAHDMTQGAGNYGQNIAMWATSSGAQSLGEQGAMGLAIDNYWYNGEVNSYLPSYYGQSTPDMSNFDAWGHFSQLVWSESTQVGCKAQFCPSGTMYDDMDAWFMVCNYRPAGNVGGGYGNNVKAPLGEAAYVYSS